MVSTIRYSANASSDHHPNQVPGILIIMNPKQPNLPTCSVTSTYLLFHLLSNPSLHLIANTTLGIIMTAIKISPKTLNHSILSTITNFDFLNSPNLNFTYHTINRHKFFHSLNQTVLMHTIVSGTPVIFTFSFIVCRLPLPFLLLPPTLHYDSKTVLHAACCVSECPDF